MAKIKPFCMPKWGIEMTEGTLAEWMVREGDAFTRGQTLCLIETDKITNEVDAEYDAVVKKIIVPAGGDAQSVGVLLAVFADADTSDAEIDAFIGNFKAANVSVAARTAAPAAPASAAANLAAEKIATNLPISPAALKLAGQLGVDLAGVEGSGKGGRISFQDVSQASRPTAALVLAGPADLAPAQDVHYASPLAKRLAALHGVSLSAIAGTGRHGRIGKADVLARVAKPGAVAASPASSLPVSNLPVSNVPTIIPMDKIRKVIARRLTLAKQTIPHFHLRMSVRVDALLALRSTANLVLGVKASINDYLVRAAALALARHRDVNIQVHGDDIHHFAHADIAIAVASPSGLVTPILRAADCLSVAQIAAGTASLIARAQAGKLAYADMDGGTFSMSNLGMFGIDQFDAIINPPHGAILAVGAITRMAVELPNATVGFESRMALSLAADHRAIDGAAGAQFMATLKGLIETPAGLF